MADLVLTGISGTTYEYSLASVNNWVWNPVPGNYAMVGDDGRVLYVGETKNFTTRDPGPQHEKWDEACGYGPVFIYAHVNHGGENARRNEERDLILAYNPPCNVQNKLRGLGGLGAPLLSGRLRNELSGLAPLAPRK